MNVIFLDFDGVLDTFHLRENKDVEKKIKILSEITKEYDCKVVIEASAKDAINEKTLEVEGKWVGFIFEMFKKYGIECIGRTPNLKVDSARYKHYNIWKEDEIRMYLLKHPEIDHFCIIDDDDLKAMRMKSDFDKVRDYLVTTNDYDAENYEKEGLLEEHKEEIGKILKKENRFQKTAKIIAKRHPNFLEDEDDEYE